MKKITGQEFITPRELEESLLTRDLEELESRLEMIVPISWCSSGCGTQKSG